MRRLLFCIVLVLPLLAGCDLAFAQTADAEEEGREIFGLITHPFSKVEFVRYGGVEDIGVNFITAVEFDLGKAFGDLKLTLYDVLTAEENELAPWDQSVAISVGFYW